MTATAGIVIRIISITGIRFTPTISTRDGLPEYMSRESPNVSILHDPFELWVRLLTPCWTGRVALRKMERSVAIEMTTLAGAGVRSRARARSGK